MRASGDRDPTERAPCPGDRAVSPVIAVILMVAITVVLAATVYVWTSGFAQGDSGPEQASATANGLSLNGDDVNWIQVTLVRGENAPYGEQQVGYTVLPPSGDARTDEGPASTLSDDVLCTDAKLAGTSCDTVDFHGDPGTNTWDAGEALYVPCKNEGTHAVTISIEGTVVLDREIDCDAAA